MEKVISKLRKWLINWDALTLVLGAILVYFAEDIVTMLYPLDPPPSATISILYYLVFFSISVFWLFKGIAYWSIKLSWDYMYEYLETKLDDDISNLTPFQRVCVSLSFYLFLAFLLVITFIGTVSVM